MAKKVVLSSTAKLKLEELLVYLKQETVGESKASVYRKLDIKINLVTSEKLSRIQSV